MLRVFLSDEIENETGFSTDTSRGVVNTVHSFHNIRIYRDDNGQWYSSALNLNDEVPENIEKFMTYVTFYANVQPNPPREIGVYGGDDVYPDAECVLDWIGNSHYHLKFRGKNPESVKALYDAIRIGTVRPRESFEGKQLGLSRLDLERENALLEVENGRLKDDLKATATEAVEQTAQISKLAESIGKRFLPWISVETVRSSLVQLISFNPNEE